MNKQRRFSIYMNEDDYQALQELGSVVDPEGKHSRSQLVSVSIKVLLAMFREYPEDDRKWREAVKLGRSTAD